MNQLPDPDESDKRLKKMHELNAKEQRLFSARADLEDTSTCTCTLCPPPDRLEQFDYCCKSLFIFPPRKKGQMLRDGLKEKLDQSESTPCICLQSYFKDFLLTDAAAQAAVSPRNYESGTVEEDENRSKRYACYRVTVASLMGPLGRGHRIRVPACVIEEMERLCVVCNVRNKQKLMHIFTTNVTRRDQWVKSICQTTSQEEELYRRLNSTVSPYICSSHFSPSDYDHPNPYTSILRANAVPCVRSTVKGNPSPTVILPPSSSPPSPGFLFSSSSAALPSSSRPPSLSSLQPPPCCTCCCRPQTREDLKRDPNWRPLPPTTQNLPDCENLIISRDSLLTLIRKCRVCAKGENHLSFRMDGMAITATGECNTCGIKTRSL